MNRLALWAALWCLPAVAASVEPPAPLQMTAAQVVEKNVAARGGLDAWRKVQTMAWMGHIDAGNAKGARLPFVLEMKRPDKTRFEIRAQSQRFVRMFDGTHGWKLRPTRSGVPEVQPYTADETTFAADGQSLDGPLLDYQAKGIHVELEGTDQVEGQKAYRLEVQLPSGARHHVWIDATTFLDIKSDRVARNASGMSGTVTMVYRDYRTVDGLKIPFVIESGAAAGKTTDRMVLDKVFVNPPLKDWIFARPNVPGRRGAMAAAVDSPAIPHHPAWPGNPGPRGSFALKPAALAGAANVR